MKFQAPNSKFQTNPNDQMIKMGHGKKFDLEDRTLRFAKDVVLLCRGLEKNVVNRELTGQLVRAAGSVGANYREANESLSKKDFVYRIKICRKESKETSYWLELIRESNGNASDICRLLGEALELRKIFSSIAERSK